MDMRYDVCTKCRKDLELENAVFFRHCHHVYCVDCTKQIHNCECHRNGIPERFADTELNKRRYKLYLALMRNEDCESEVDEGDVVPMETGPEENESEEEEESEDETSHEIKTYQVYAAQNLDRLQAEVVDNPDFDCQIALEKFKV